MVPKSWCVETVGDLFEMQLGKMLSPKAKRSSSPRPYLANRHVQWERIDCDDLEYMDFDDGEREKYRLSDWDLLVCEGGEVGRTALWRGELDECYFQKAVHRLRPKDYRIRSYYMLAYMMVTADRGKLVDLTSQTSISHLTQEKLALLPVTCPDPREQEAVGSTLLALDSQRMAMNSGKNKLRIFKSGLMDDLLTGKVRVDDLPGNLEELLAVRSGEEI
jgi:type I restriction enzyme S subunit